MRITAMMLALGLAAASPAAASRKPITIGSAKRAVRINAEGILQGFTERPPRVQSRCWHRSPVLVTCRVHASGERAAVRFLATVWDSGGEFFVSDSHLHVAPN